MHNSLFFHTIWTVVDSHWINILHEQINGNHSESLPVVEDMLFMYLWKHGFEIPDTITYCLAENDKYALKFREYGADIHIYITFKD